MLTKGWKRLVAGVAAAAVAVAGVVLWLGHRERVAKDALAAEIRAERAARVRPAPPAPTAEETATAELYLVALSKVSMDHLESGESGLEDALDEAPWTATPQAVTEQLAKNAEALEFSDRALARGACRFAEPLLRKWSSSHRLRRLLFARGHAALAGGSPVAAAEDVRKLVRCGRDLASWRLPAETWAVGVSAELGLLTAEQQASGLLAAVATAPALPPEAGPALIAAAREEWGSAEASRRSVDVHDDAVNEFDLRMLAPDADAWWEKLHADGAAVEALLAMKPASRSIIEEAEDLVRGALRSEVEVPSAEGIRQWRAMREPVVAAVRRRDMDALRPGGPHEKTGPLFGFLGPRWFRQSVVYEARIAVARTAAAIRAFQLREGRPPRTLDELSPSVLPDVLLDPFDGKPLIYEVEGDAWRVASRVWRERAMGEDEVEGEPPPVEVRFPRAPK